MKSLPIALSALLLISSSVSAKNIFSDITVGAGYANDQVNGQSLNGYSIHSQGPIVEPLKDYLFSDFRVTQTSSHYFSSDFSSDKEQQLTDTDLSRYQAGLGLGMPYHVTQGVVVKPYVTAGWSWDRSESNITGAIIKKSDNSFIASAGLKGEFGKHFITGIGYSKETSGLKAGQFMVDLGYKF